MMYNCAILCNAETSNRLKVILKFQRTSLSYMLYLADNLAYFPYMVQDEPLFIVHHIDIMISVSGTNLLQSFKEGLITPENNQQPQLQIQQSQLLQQQLQQIQPLPPPPPPPPPPQQLQQQQHIQIETANPDTAGNNVVSALDEDDEDEDLLVSRVPIDTRELQAYITTAQGCLLLLMLKQHIKEIYGLSDSKIQQYSPSEAAKVYEKAASRRSNTQFNPKGTIQKLKEDTSTEYLDADGRRNLIKEYLDFKQLMMKLDPDDVDDEENSKMLNTLASPMNSSTNQSIVAAASILTEADQVALRNYKVNSSPPKVPKLVISSRRLDSESKQRTPKSQRSSDKIRKHKHKKKRRKYASSGEESENDYSDPDFLI